jgi:DNA processing protein
MSVASVMDPEQVDLLKVSHLPGVGPVLLERLLVALGTPGAVLEASSERLRAVPGIGPERAGKIVAGRDAAARTAERELELAAKLGVRIVTKRDAEYPHLLASIPSPPMLLYVRGRIEPLAGDRFPVAIVGSRQCTQYGREQAERFAGHLASSGITIVSGGARGIDAVAHRAAIRAAGRTIAVLGCGLQHIYPQEHAELFEAIAGGRGAIVSELPLATAPSAENFPARNRIISGISLGTLVIEAGKHSGSLITAKIATEEHGREVFAVPGRVDSTASEGTLELLKGGGAAMVTAPADVLELLDGPARHAEAGSFGARFGPAADVKRAAESGDGQLPFSSGNVLPAAPATPRTATLSPSQRKVVAALTATALSADELIRETKLEPAQVRADLTILELRRLVVRSGTRFVRAE